MPYHARKDDRCSSDKPWGVTDEDGKLYGCHASKEDAQNQIGAISSNEEDSAEESQMTVPTKTRTMGRRRPTRLADAPPTPPPAGAPPASDTKCPECGHAPHGGKTCAMQGCDCTSNATPAPGKPDGTPAPSGASARGARLADAPTPPPAAPADGGDGGDGGDGSDTADPNDLAAQTDNALDAAQAALAAVDPTTVGPEIQSFIGLVNAADAVVDILLAAMGVDDPDETVTAPADADVNSLAEAVDAAIVAARNSVDGVDLSGAPDGVSTAIDSVAQADDLSGQLLAALGLYDPDAEEGTDPTDAPDGGTDPAPPGGDVSASSRGRQFADGEPAPGEPGAGDQTNTQFEMPVMVLEGVDTGDGRYIRPHALTWRDLPIVVMGITKTGFGHEGAELVARLDEIERFDASELVNPKTGQPYGNVTYTDPETGEDVTGPVQGLRGRGEFASIEMAQTMAQLIEDGFLRGVSVDLSDVTSDIVLLDESGDPVSEDEEMDLLDALFLDGDMREEVSAGRVMGATVCPFPAFEGAYIQITGGPSTSPVQNAAKPSQSAAIRITDVYGERECEPCESGGSLVASAGPLAPPKSWFEDPHLEGVTPLTIERDGRVFGHIAVWGSCHTGFSGRCVTPPKSYSDYAYFRLGALMTAEGELVSVGHLTMDTGHASTTGTNVSMRDALAHYDNTGNVAADVAAGEDQWGIWIAGATRPELTELQIRKLRASAVSGDWRSVGGRLELVHALAVNSPGYPVVRAHVASGATVALVAAGSRQVQRRAEVSHEEMAELLAWKREVEPQLLELRASQLRGRVHHRV